MTIKAPRGVHAVAFNLDGRHLLGANLACVVYLWDAVSGKELRAWPLPGQANCLAFTPEGRQLITGNADGTLYELELP